MWLLDSIWTHSSQYFVGPGNSAPGVRISRGVEDNVGRDHVPDGEARERRAQREERRVPEAWGSGRICASGVEAPQSLANLVYMEWTNMKWMRGGAKRAMRPSPAETAAVVGQVKLAEHQAPCHEGLLELRLHQPRTLMSFGHHPVYLLSDYPYKIYRVVSE